MKDKQRYTAEAVAGGTVTGFLTVRDGVYQIHVQHEGVSTLAAWEVLPETVKEVDTVEGESERSS